MEPNYRLFASNFLIYDSLMLLQAYQQTGENKLAASLDLCFISGMHDMIIFSVCPEGLEMAAISGADLRLRMKETLDCPSSPFKTPKTGKMAFRANEKAFPRKPFYIRPYAALVQRHFRLWAGHAHKKMQMQQYPPPFPFIRIPAIKTNGCCPSGILQ